MSFNSSTNSPVPGPGMFDFDQLLATHVLRVVLGAISITGNAFNLYLFCRFPKLRASSSNMLVVLMSISNLFTGVGIIIRAGYGFYSLERGLVLFTKEACQLANIVLGFGISSTQAIVTGVAFDRLAAVYRPTQHNTSMMIPFVTLVVTVVYTVAIAFVSVESTNGSDLIPVCSMAPAGGPRFSITFAVCGGLQIVVFLSVYLLTLYLIRTRLNQHQQQRNKGVSSVQIKVFVWVSLVLLTQFVFWHIPIGFLIVSMAFQFPASLKTYVTLAIGLGSGLNAAAETVIRLSKHYEIKEYVKMVLFRTGTVSNLHMTTSKMRVEKLKSTTRTRHIPVAVKNGRF